MLAILPVWVQDCGIGTELVSCSLYSTVDQEVRETHKTNQMIVTAEPGGLSFVCYQLALGLNSETLQRSCSQITHPMIKLYRYWGNGLGARWLYCNTNFAKIFCETIARKGLSAPRHSRTKETRCLTRLINREKLVWFFSHSKSLHNRQGY